MTHSQPYFFQTSGIVALMLPLLLASCGGDGKQANTICTVQSVTLTPQQGSLRVGQTLQLTASPVIGPTACTGTPDTTVAWSSSDSTKARVQSGIVTGVASGTSTIAARIGDQTASVNVTVSALATGQTTLQVNEVGSGWLELYNSGQKPAALNEYRLRSASWLPVNGEWTNYQEYTWTLPAVVVPAGGYVFVRRTAMDTNQQPRHYADTARWVELGEPGRMFYTSGANGFVDLLHGNESADFVRWGKSDVTPTTNVGAVTTLAIPELGSLVRTASNALEARTFPTPGGPNDVPANATDTDQDGIPDTAEVAGGHLAGLDLYAMGARVGIPDIFVEIDAMASNDPGIDVSQDAFNLVIAAFRNKGYALHLDRGNRFSSAFNPASLNLGNENNSLPYSAQVWLSTEEGAKLEGNLQPLKRQYFDPRRLTTFHYAVMGSKTPDAVGRGERPGNDFIVAREGYSSFFGAKTLMHELGHNLGLQHGGFEENNSKPNYFSVMNVRYDCLVFQPGAKDCQMDYSDGSSKDLNEEHLDEQVGWGRSAFFADWNKNGVIDRDLKADIDQDGQYRVLKDYNDWANLKPAFARDVDYGNLRYLSIPASSKPALTILGDDEQPSED